MGAKKGAAMPSSRLVADQDNERVGVDEGSGKAGPISLKLWRGYCAEMEEAILRGKNGLG